MPYPNAKYPPVATKTAPPDWMQRPFMVDPPQGWRYGFPRRYDPASDGDMQAWMISKGYPAALAKLGLPCSFTAIPESDT